VETKFRSRLRCWVSGHESGERGFKLFERTNVRSLTLNGVATLSRRVAEIAYIDHGKTMIKEGDHRADTVIAQAPYILAIVTFIKMPAPNQPWTSGDDCL
jgi:hypothetical protein